LKQPRVSSLRIEHLWPLITVAGVFVFVATHPVLPYDFWWHLRAGDVIASSGAIPATDTFSYTMAGSAYDNYASYWLVEVVYHFLYRLGALPLVITAHAVVVTAAYTIILWLSFRISGSLRLGSVAVLFAIVLGLDNWNVRPQAAGYLFFAVCLFAIWSYREHSRKWLLALPPLSIALWANCHGSYFLGFVLLGIWLADSVWMGLKPGMRSRLAGGSAVRPNLGPARIPALLLLISGAASLLNPRGLRAFSYIGAISGNAVIRNAVVEWRHPTLDSSGGAAFIVALLLVAVLFSVSPRRPVLFTLLTYFVFAFLGLSAIRSVVWFGLALAPAVSAHLAAVGANSRLRRSPSSSQTPGTVGSVLNYCIAAVVLVGVVAALPWFKHALPLSPRKAGLVGLETPVEATSILIDRRLPRELFNDMGFGSYLIWAARDVPVYIDTRIELYPISLWQEYLSISAAEAGWETRLEARGVKTLMLNPESQAPLIQAAGQSPNWRLVWEDANAVLLTRTEKP